MKKPTSAIIAIVLLASSSAFAKDKTKATLPAYVLQAHTVSVVIDPNAGVSLADPRANEVAQKDVETALLNWGRFEPVLSSRGADLIIVVRKGHGRLVEQTVSDPRQNNRAGAITPIDNGVAIGAQHGHQAPLGDASSSGLGSDTPHPQTQIGDQDDYFAVYEGGGTNPLDASPVWRYSTKDGLQSPAVPAVAEFKKALAEAEKAAAKRP